MKHLVSICIAAAKYDKSAEYFHRLLKSIAGQSWKDCEIVVSDHDDSSNETHDIISFPEHQHLSIKYIRCHDKKGYAGANLNNAIKHASGRYIKTMFTDDFFSCKDSLLDMIRGIRGYKWLVTGCLHYDDNDRDYGMYHMPDFDPTLRGCHGNNLIGSPSVVMFERDGCELFDDNLLHYVDCEMYYRMGKKFGPPTFINKPLVYIRLSPNGVSGRINEEQRMKEHHYIDQKHGVGF